MRQHRVFVKSRQNANNKHSYNLILIQWNDPVLLRSVYGINRLTPNDPYMGRTTPLTSKRCILYIYSTNIGTEYFKHAVYSPFFFLFKMQFVSYC